MVTKKTKKWNAYSMIGLELPINDIPCKGKNDSSTVQRALCQHAPLMTEGDVMRVSCVLLSGFKMRSMYIRWMWQGVSWKSVGESDRTRTTSVKSIDTFIHQTHGLLFGRLYRYIGESAPPATKQRANECMTTTRAKAYESVLNLREKHVFDNQLVPMITNENARQEYTRMLRGPSKTVKVCICQEGQVVSIILTDDLRFDALGIGPKDTPPHVDAVVSWF